MRMRLRRETERGDREGEITRKIVKLHDSTARSQPDEREGKRGRGL